MTQHRSQARAAFRVIDGGVPAQSRPRSEGTLPDPLNFGAAELAAEMADLFAMGLLAEAPVAGLRDPHHAVWVDGATRFTLHELLCELRSLPWNDAATARRPCNAAAAERRAQRWNRDGQLTLRTLFRASVALPDGGARLSALFRSDRCMAEPQGAEAQPERGAGMSDWLDWAARQSGAGLHLPGFPALVPDLETLGDLAAHVRQMPPARPFHNAALAALARGTPFDPGLAGLWGGPQLLALMAEAEIRVRRLLSRLALRGGRLTRPAVSAARMTVQLAREERSAAADGAVLRAAAEELTAAAPTLLHWVSRANARARGPQRFARALFLPLGGDGGVQAADLVAHVAVAGALGTLLKAAFDTSRLRRMDLGGGAGTGIALETETDLLCANIALARLVTGGHYPAENARDLRLGQGVALQVLREALEEEGRSAELGFCDLDGRKVVLRAHPRIRGRGQAELRLDGQPAPWPEERRASHLTAVV
jgi:hypothetical protein